MGFTVTWAHPALRSRPTVTAPDSRATRAVVIVFFTVFLDLVGFGIVIPLLPLYVRAIGGTAQSVGFLFGCFSATQLVATPILGRLSDRFGRRRVILTSLLGNAASMVLFAFATHLRLLPLLFVSRIVAGATAGNIAACQAAVADVTSGSDRAKGMGRIGAGIGLGMVVGPAIGSFFSPLGPAAPPLAAGALAFIDLIAAFFLMPETRKPSAALAEPIPPRRPQSPANTVTLPRVFAALAEPRIATILILYFFTFLYMTTLQVALPLLGEARLGWTAVDIGHVFTMFGLLGLIIQGGMLGWLTRSFGARNLVVFGSLSSLVGLLMMAGAHSTLTLTSGLGLLGVGLGLTTPLLSTLASQCAGDERQGLVLGYSQSAGGLARTVGPIASGALYAHVGPGAAFVGGAGSAFVALVIAMIMRSPD
jgi:MFS transporter, DHA1 family, tetracycline resistance protein